MNAWAQHFFFALFHIARVEALESAGSFDPGLYGLAPRATRIFLAMRIVLWLVVFLGLDLVAWGIWEEQQLGLAD